MIFTERATLDIERIYEGLAIRFGKRRAGEAAEELYSHCLGFDLFPERGRMRHDAEPGLRTVGYRRMATIAFRVEPSQVTIVRIFAAGRDIRFDDL
ncbi:type II toxin-antitoxin system RelE/ParE family toxin [Aureimonas leprariae]|uniref:type II toxin-antitoxin system RelE/ParE family toxin n=1 Tax=Plantimonas leprariae TaxID=2615207 RepID=UPI001386B355|nr:type II toxin-antitoxin system RelE/ParE family toxin [Aureimonas leprariae]